MIEEAVLRMIMRVDYDYALEVIIDQMRLTLADKPFTKLRSLTLADIPLAEITPLGGCVTSGIGGLAPPSAAARGMAT